MGGWVMLILFCIAIAALLIFLIRQNIRDQRGYTRNITRTRYYHHPKKDADKPSEDVPK
ncbi:MAG: hypothetical protein U0U70_00575 [Chitinophagaceae bacterium]